MDKGRTGEGMEEFEILGVTPDAGPEEIRAAFRRQARAVHPDLRLIRGGAEDPAPAPAASADPAQALLELTEARRRALARRSASDALDAVQVPAQRRAGERGSATGRTPTRDDDPMLVLLTLPQRCRGVWPGPALEVWALTLVPAARAVLADARRAAEEAGAIATRHRVQATAHALLTLTLRSRSGRRCAVLHPHLEAAYAALERDLPAVVVDRLPARFTPPPERRRVTLLAGAVGAVGGGLVVWADLPGRLLG